MKGKRQEKILEIIRTNDIETQEELTKKLSEAGFFPVVFPSFLSPLLFIKASPLKSAQS